MNEGQRTFEEFASEYRPQIDAALEESIEGIGDGCPARLRDAMRYSLLLPGKRIRPLLVLLAAEACGGSVTDAMPAAVAVEMIHAFSLIHDDLPAMDDDDLRRGQPTNHNVYGEGMALLAGDALLAHAFAILAWGISDPAVARDCVQILADASGPAGMAGGQGDDLLGLSDAAPIDDLRSLHLRKTGALLEASVRMGAWIAGTTPEKLDAFGIYGRNIGLAYQIIDDVLDVEGDVKVTGKAVRKDAEKGKKTFPEFLGVEGSREEATMLTEDGCAALGQVFGSCPVVLNDLAHSLLQRDH